MIDAYEEIAAIIVRDTASDAKVGCALSAGQRHSDRIVAMQ